MKLADVDLSADLPKREYEDRLAANRLPLLRAQTGLIRERRPAILVFEGWDAAGKGGSIKRLIEYLDPRKIHTYGISKPTADELDRHYLWRFWRRIPPRGEIAIFDRSWYGRVLVERIEEFCDKKEWKRAYDEINRFEIDLVAAGYVLVKYFLHISKDEQKLRFEKREKDPLKAWKMSDEDYRNREKWKQYEKAIDDMLEKCNEIPWHVIPANSKRNARVLVQDVFLAEIDQALGK